MLKPFPQSFWIKESLLCAGHYPGDIDEAVHLTKLNSLLDCGIRRVINLMEEHEVNYGGRPFRPYDSTLAELAAIRSNDGIKNQIPTYVHCWGGHGRTGTFACCYLMQEGLSANEALTRLLQWRERLPRNHFPLEDEQWQFVEQAHAWLS